MPCAPTCQGPFVKATLFPSGRSSGSTCTGNPVVGWDGWVMGWLGYGVAPTAMEETLSRARTTVSSTIETLCRRKMLLAKDHETGKLLSRSFNQ